MSFWRTPESRETAGMPDPSSRTSSGTGMARVSYFIARTIKPMKKPFAEAHVPHSHDGSFFSET
jgi:hypothetical protein